MTFRTAARVKAGPQTSSDLDNLSKALPALLKRLDYVRIYAFYWIAKINMQGCSTTRGTMTANDNQQYQKQYCRKVS